MSGFWSARALPTGKPGARVPPGTSAEMIETVFGQAKTPSGAVVIVVEGGTVRCSRVRNGIQKVPAVPGWRWSAVVVCWCRLARVWDSDVARCVFGRQQARQELQVQDFWARAVPPRPQKAWSPPATKLSLHQLPAAASSAVRTRRDQTQGWRTREPLALGGGGDGGGSTAVPGAIGGSPVVRQGQQVFAIFEEFAHVGTGLFERRRCGGVRT